MKYKVCSAYAYRGEMQPDDPDVDSWRECDSLDPEDAARDYCRWCDQQGDYCEGYPQGENCIVFDGSSYTIFEIFTDFSASYSAYEQSEWTPPTPTKEA